VEIKAAAIAWGVGFASVAEIAELNILHATGLAMRRAVEALAVTPVHALVDGNYRFPLPCRVQTVVGGDGKSKSIAAASILAKVARDRLMAEMDALYPGYGFAAHKGYGAKRHAECPPLPGRVEIGLVLFGRDRPETHLSAEILRPVHAGCLVCCGSWASAVPIIASRLTSSASRSSLQPSVPAGGIGTTR